MRDCQCKRANHVRGTRQAYVIDKCRCTPCREANSAVERHNRKQRAYGRYDTGRVDAGPVRERVEYLQANGLGIKRISVLAGVSNSTVGKILYGDPSRNMPPRARVEKHVAEGIMNVRLGLDVLGSTVQVPAVGTVRRIQALACMGYSLSFQAQRIGVSPGSLWKTMHTATVHAQTARKVTALFNELWGTPRVGTCQRSRASVSRTRALARLKGWLPPLAWDEDRIDDPKHRGYASMVELA